MWFRPDDGRLSKNFEIPLLITTAVVAAAWFVGGLLAGVLGAVALVAARRARMLVPYVPLACIISVVSFVVVLFGGWGPLSCAQLAVILIADYAVGYFAWLLLVYLPQIPRREAKSALGWLAWAALGGSIMGASIDMNETETVALWAGLFLLWFVMYARGYWRIWKPTTSEA